ncbi:hypothetical protein [Lactobacillus xujianguonis]|uniref:hypothetical protein n=1 Tax=Lactobacillus xujianguonis TaxID=2495899 RepID=UPI000FD7D3FE|nr:hypothetical protein [Lactobacillus xujianguonis]RVU72390.1 hypothetical protein EJK20_10165 [Lactobacillus xujianguonis]
MAKRKVELDSQADKLAEKYMELTESDFNELTNAALKYYISKRLSSKEIRQIMKEKDSEDSKYLDEYLQHTLNSNWNI